MTKAKYKITTSSGYYITDDRGYVIRCDNGLNKENANLHDLMTWQIIGIREIKAFNNLGSIIRLDEASKLKSLCFKNGKSKYAICDIDHGTARIHGNYQYHGATSITTLQ